jgi:hypothetical protein
MAEKAKSKADPVNLKVGGKTYTFEPDDRVPCTRPDGQPALVPAWRLKDLIMEKEFKLGYPEKKKAAAAK